MQKHSPLSNQHNHIGSRAHKQFIAEPEGELGAESRPKRKANPEFGERKKRQQSKATTVIKTGFLKLSRDNIACEASQLATLHVTRLLSEGTERAPPLSQTFFSRCLASIANMGTGLTCAKAAPGLFKSAQQSSLLLPEDYEPIERPPCLTRLLENIAHQSEENFAVSDSETLLNRLGRWFRLKIHEYSTTIGRTYFSDNASSIVKSLGPRRS